MERMMYRDGDDQEQAFTPTKSGPQSTVSWPPTSFFRPTTLRHGEEVYKVRIYCLDQRKKHHRHAAMAKVAGRMLRAEGGSEDEALASFIRLLDPDVERINSIDGKRLA